MIAWQLVLTGVVIGVAVAAPIGPINILCIQRSLQQGFGAGLLTGMGAVLGDGMFAAIAAFSITSVSELLIDNNHWIEVVGGLFLIILGVRSLWVAPEITPVQSGLNIVGNSALVGTTFILTITNPAMILGFAAFFGSAGGLIKFPQNYWEATILVAAVMIGSFLWWAFLAGIMHRFRSKIGSNAILIINRVSGGLIAVFGAVILVRVIIAEYGLW